MLAWPCVQALACPDVCILTSLEAYGVCMCNRAPVQVQSSMRGISSLAKETTKLEVGRDATGATCINQYVVVKTLGRGAFGKVKLCLNTLDGNLYAVKVRSRHGPSWDSQQPAGRCDHKGFGQMRSTWMALEMQQMWFAARACCAFAHDHEVHRHACSH